jgi:hypothetical protein
MRVMLEFVTFLLAPIAYAGLAIAAVRAVRRRPSRTLQRAVATVAVAHVALVWSVRYGLQLSAATRNGYAGFLLFHAVLLAIVASALVAERIARPLLVTAFGVVTLGALGAVFAEPVVVMYRIPVILIALGGAIGLVYAYRAKRREGHAWIS